MQTKDVMDTVVVAVRPEASFIDVVDTMLRFKIGTITVIDADKRPIGVISENDLFLKETDPGEHTSGIFESRRKSEERRKAAGATAGEIMTTPMITVTGGTSVRGVARLMHRYRIKQLPVVDAVTGRITGCVRQSDLLKVFARPAEEIDQEITEICDRLYVNREKLAVGIEAGVVTLTGQVGFRSQISRLVAAVRGIEGVLTIEHSLTCRSDDLVRVPPLYL
ncbi:CBS domain-containing protein [Streptosporangium sp. NPDC000396]|uniref:CBS domain-containing protein n=1 Tax=Streptosporangium sp. NPDC000396 TaxID=3366185 RepID=UPI003681D160